MRLKTLLGCSLRISTDALGNDFEQKALLEGGDAEDGSSFDGHLLSFVGLVEDGDRHLPDRRRNHELGQIGVLLGQIIERSCFIGPSTVPRVQHLIFMSFGVID